MKDIENIVNESIKSMVESGSLEKIIHDKTKNAVESVITEQFGRYGTFTKEIEKSIKEGFKFNLKTIPFEIYSEQMLVAVKQQIGEYFRDVAGEKLKKSVEDIFEPLPDTMTFNDFVEKIVSFWREEYEEDGCDCHGEFSDRAIVEIKKTDYSDSAYSVSIYKNSVTDTYSYSRKKYADVQLYFIDNKLKINHRHCFNPTCIYDMDLFIFKVYCSDISITDIDKFNEDECDLSIKENEY